MKKKGIIGISIFSLAALSSVPLTLDIAFFALPDVYQHTFYGAMHSKLRLLGQEGKKIIVIGGSSVPFSLDSHYIKKYLPQYEPVNFGLYASLGTNMMLDLASSHIGKGDIVIVSPEISSQTLSMYYNGLETLKALEQDKGALWRVDSRMKESVLGAIPSFVGEKTSYISKNNIPEPKDIYAASSFNEYGDIGVERKGNIMLDGMDDNAPIALDCSIINDEFIAKLNDFNKHCLEKGATCYYRFSPMNNASIIHKDNVETFYDYLHKKLSFEIMGDPYQAIMEKEWFYDTNFHLNSSGVIHWTKQLIKDIKLTLDDASPTDIPEPDKPPLINPREDEDGDNAYLEYFTYEEKEDEVAITGLKDSAEKIILPYRYNGKIITSFNAKVFQENKTIKEITLQNNVRLIHDRSFADSQIERIVILNVQPNSISVGDELLYGSKANIYVDAENLSAYKTSYNWSKYASQIFAI